MNPKGYYRKKGYICELIESEEKKDNIGTFVEDSKKPCICILTGKECVGNYNRKYLGPNDHIYRYRGGQKCPLFTSDIEKAKKIRKEYSNQITRTNQK